MKELKVTVNGKEYKAPRPKAQQYKDYILFLNRERSEDVEKEFDARFTYIASLFQNPDITLESLLAGASFEEIAAIELGDTLKWLEQFIPQRDEKNA